MARLDRRGALHGEKRLTDPQCRALALLQFAGGKIVCDGVGYRHGSIPLVVPARTMNALQSAGYVDIDVAEGRETARIGPRGLEFLMFIGLCALMDEVKAEMAGSACQGSST